MMEESEESDAGLVINVGALEIDVPRSAGFYGGVALAVMVGLIDPPLGLFIAAVPLVKMLTSRRFPIAVRFVGQFLEGSAKPVGGDAEGTIRLPDGPVAKPRVSRSPAAKSQAAKPRAARSGTRASGSPDGRARPRPARS
jgi:hypothetical protein